MTTETLPAVRPAPLEPTTPIKPSEAIRLGCLVAPVQEFNWFGSRRWRQACALGAMNIGYGYRVDRQCTVSRRYGPTPLTCPACGVVDEYTIGHLNDDHRWSRERIANWLEGLGL